MKCPKYDLIAGLEGEDDILYKGNVFRIHEVSFDLDEQSDSCTLNVNYTQIAGDDIIETSEFKNAIGRIALDVMEKHLAIKEIKQIIADNKNGGT